MLIVALNAFGLVLASWGVSMLLGTQDPFPPIVEATMTVIGLAVVAVGTCWTAVLVLIEGARNMEGAREQRSPQTNDIPARATPATSPVPHRDRVLMAMAELHDSAIDLIERWTELRRMNLRQWHNEHREGSPGEIEATKRYRLAKTNLEIYRQSLPPHFWSPVDRFAEAIEESISREAYATPSDTGVYESMNRDWHQAMQGINDISFGLPTNGSVGRASVN